MLLVNGVAYFNKRKQQMLLINVSTSHDVWLYASCHGDKKDIHFIIMMIAHVYAFKSSTILACPR